MGVKRHMETVDFKNARIFLKQYNLTELAKTANIPYSTLSRLSKASTAKTVQDVSAIFCYKLSKATEIPVETIIEVMYGIRGLGIPTKEVING